MSNKCSRLSDSLYPSFDTSKTTSFILSDYNDCSQLVFDSKIGKHVSIIQPTNQYTPNTPASSELCGTTSIIGKNEQYAKNDRKRKCGDETGSSTMDLERTLLMESFTRREQLKSINSSHIVESEIDNNSSLPHHSNRWSVTPKSVFCRDIECTQDLTQSQSSTCSSITTRKLIEYNPTKAKKTDASLESRELSWKNPVLGVDMQDSLPSVVDNSTSRVLRHSNFDKIYNSVSFTKSALKDIEVLGQVEKQFLPCILRDSTEEKALVLIDQHAAHERVRLEKLLKQVGYYETKTSVLKHGVCRLVPPAEVLFYDNEIDLLIHYTKEFSDVGLRFSVLKKQQSTAYRKVFVSSVPSIFVNVCQQQTEAKGSHVNESLIKEFIHEQARLLRCSGVGKCSLSSPTIFKVLASYACHGAIKFGDALGRTECVRLVRQLSKCHLPFQCAHGRPSIIPLLRLDTISSIQKSRARSKPNLSRLKNRNYVTFKLPNHTYL